MCLWSSLKRVLMKVINSKLGMWLYNNVLLKPMSVLSGTNLNGEQYNYIFCRHQIVSWRLVCYLKQVLMTQHRRMSVLASLVDHFAIVFSDS